MQQPNAVFELASPVRPETIARLQRYPTLRCRSTLSAEDCTRLNAHFANHPQALLHVCPPVRDSAQTDFSFLEYLPALRRLWLQCKSGELIDLGCLSALPVGLHEFSLDTLEQSGDSKRDRPKRSLDVLSALHELQHLSICGRLESLDLIGTLPALRSLALWRTRLKSLAGIEHAPHLQRLELLASGAKDLTSLAALRELTFLRIDRQRNLSGLDAIARLPNLRELHLISSTFEDELPSFAQLTSLHVAVLDNLAAPDNLERIAAAPELRCLVLSRSTPLYDVAALTPLQRHPHLKELRLDTGNEGLLARIRDAYGWKCSAGFGAP